MHTIVCLLDSVLSVFTVASDYFNGIFKGIKCTWFHIISIKSGYTLVYSNNLSIKTYITIVYWKLQIIKKSISGYYSNLSWHVYNQMYFAQIFKVLFHKLMVYENRCYYNHCLVNSLFNKILLLSTFIVKLKSILDKIITILTMRINW